MSMGQGDKQGGEARRYLKEMCVVSSHITIIVLRVLSYVVGILDDGSS